jgi:hypothetical protein
MTIKELLDKTLNEDRIRIGAHDWLVEELAITNEGQVNHKEHGFMSFLHRTFTVELIDPGLVFAHTTLMGYILPDGTLSKDGVSPLEIG